MADPVTPYWLNLVAAIAPAASILGLLGAAIIGYRSDRTLEREKRESESRHLAAAFVGELVAIRRIVTVRGYGDLIKRFAERVESHGSTSVPKLHVRQNYLGVYESNAGRLGLLPSDIVADLAILYTSMKSVIDDLNTMADGKLDEKDPEFVARFLRELEKIYFETLERADNVIERLACYANVDIPKDLKKAEPEKSS